MRRFRRYFRLRPRNREVLSEHVKDEIRLHVDLRIEQLIRAGKPRAEAEIEAWRRFGDSERPLVRSARQRERMVNLADWFRDLRQDVRYAWRGMVREPLLTITVVLTLALGIGANAAMFGIIDRLLLRGPAHVREAGSVVRLYGTATDAATGTSTSSKFNYATYGLLRERERSFESVAAYNIGSAMLGRRESAKEIRVGRATSEFFPLLGVSAYRGRFWTVEEDSPPKGRNVAVLSYEFWQGRFAGDAGTIGREVELDGELYTVIGIAPAGFTGAELERVDAWRPMSTGAPILPEWWDSWGGRWLDVIVRLKPGVSAEAAASDAQAAYGSSLDVSSRPRFATLRLSFAPLRYTRQGTEPAEVAVSRWLVGVAVIVLLIACANVANLLLARSIRRGREVSVRIVLGISRLRLLRLHFVETLLLALLGAGAALLVAHWGGHFVRALLLPDVVWATSPVNGRVLLFTAAAMLLTVGAIGIAPLLQAARLDLATGMRAGVREGGGRSSVLRTALTVSQAALSVVLLVGAGLFARSLWNVTQLDLGIEADRVIAVSPAWPDLPGDVSDEVRTAERLRRADYFERALERVRNLPGIEAAALAVGTPLTSAIWGTIFVPGRDSLPQLPGDGPYVTIASPGYLKTAGTALLRGRDFASSDRSGAERVMLVNETMAQALWPGQDAIGQCVRYGADTMPCSRVVGVVEDARRFNLQEQPAMQFYLPHGQVRPGERTLLIRPVAETAGWESTVRRELLQLDPAIRFIEMEPLAHSIDTQIRPWKLGATLFGVFGGLALLIATVGLYSVLAWLVASRAHEWSIRMALGAQVKDVLRLVLQQGIATIVPGLAIGCALALAAGRFIEPLLFDTPSRNPLVFAAVVCTLFGVGVAATLVPAFRATRADPAQVLRSN